MTTISLVKSRLRSTRVRKQIGQNGVRKIGTSYTPTTTKQGLIGRIWNQLKGLGGWIVEKISGVLRKINFTKIWDWIVSGFNTIWAFNWQQTDAEIDKKIAAEWHAVTVKMAGVTGRAFGHLVCGFIPAASIAVVNEPLAVYLLQKVGEEALQDLSNELNAFLQQTGRATLNTAARKAFKNIRKLIKFANRNPYYRRRVSRFINPQIIDQWGEEEGKEWSFQSFFQKQVEKLPEPWQDRVEEFVDEFSDACIESGYVIAGGLDEFFGLNAATQDFFSVFGKERTIEFYPDRDVKSEKFILKGKEELVKSQVVDIVNQGQLLENREISINLPTEEWGRIPIVESSNIEIEFEFYKFEQPPYWTKERRKDNGRQRIKLQNINRTSIKFDKLQKAFRSTPFSSGEIRTVITWESGRITKFWCQSQNEGEKVAEIFQEFSKDKIVFPLVFESRKGSPSNVSAAKYKKNYKQYLSHIKIWNWNKINKFEATKGETKKSDVKNLFKRFRCDFENEPSWWQKEVDEALKSTL
ncbi:MAG: hypothetical protein WBA13_18150 [Microcoleaceae cyanobacterium]